MTDDDPKKLAAYWAYRAGIAEAALQKHGIEHPTISIDDLVKPDDLEERTRTHLTMIRGDINHIAALIVAAPFANKLFDEVGDDADFGIDVDSMDELVRMLEETNAPDDLWEVARRAAKLIIAYVNSCIQNAAHETFEGSLSDEEIEALGEKFVSGESEH